MVAVTVVAKVALLPAPDGLCIPPTVLFPTRCLIYDIVYRSIQHVG